MARGVGPGLAVTDGWTQRGGLGGDRWMGREQERLRGAAGGGWAVVGRSPNEIERGLELGRGERREERGGCPRTQRRQGPGAG